MDEIEKSIKDKNFVQQYSTLVKAGDFAGAIDLLKSRSGYYKDNPENRKLGRVGMRYGGSTKEESILSKDTQSRYFKNGEWDKERVKRVHEPIIKEYLDKAKPQKEPVATLMMGAPASGKGTVLRYLKEFGKIKDEGVPVDPDEIKTEKIPEYKKYVEYDKKFASSKVHEEGSYLAKVVINKLTGIKSNLIIDKVFPEYNKLLKQIDVLKNSGYKVRVIYVSIDDYKEAYKRMLARGERTDRFVREDYFRWAHQNVPKAFRKLVENLPEGVSVEKYDNNVGRGESPKLVESYGTGKKEKV
jgi:predicted ABC-type ATPase